jgi:hypothetical protein
VERARRRPGDRHPAFSALSDEVVTVFIRDYFRRAADRKLSLEGARPAADVNAVDEVPCSTWFCPRQHLRPAPAETIAAGPPDGHPPQLPLTVVEGKESGVQPGFVARDAAGRRYLIKFDPVGYPGLATGAEIVGSRLFHAAGYNVAGSQPLELTAGDIDIAPDATYKLSRAAERRFTRDHLTIVLSKSAREADGGFRAVAVPWIAGDKIGAFDMQGRRKDDPNDLIPHQDRRSLRASLLLFAWLNVSDASAINTLDSFVDDGGRHFVRHYFIDFGCGLGSETNRLKGVYHGRERLLEGNRMLAALGTLGWYQRPWQRDQQVWTAEAGVPPALGWLYPVEDWRPEEFRTALKVPAHQRMTAADAYWGAKLVTSFTDADLHAVVAAARYDATAAALIEKALEVRRDRIGQRYLLAVAPLESPVLDTGGLCFDDLAIERGFRAAADVRYQFRITTADGHELVRGESAAQGPHTCLALPPQSADYLIVAVSAVAGTGAPSRPTRFHLRWRPAEGRLAVVGIEREG